MLVLVVLDKRITLAMPLIAMAALSYNTAPAGHDTVITDMIIISI